MAAHAPLITISDPQYAKQGIDLKAQAQGAADGDTTIRIEGGLPALPGTNVTMPDREMINGKSSYKLLPHQNPPPHRCGW